MAITFLLGNGFDLNCGMKTAYKDVYKGYTGGYYKFSNIDKFKRRISSDIETWADFEVAMSMDLPNFESEKEFLACLRDFKRYLTKYLTEEQQKMFELLEDIDVRKAVLKEVRDSIETFYEGISNNIKNKVEKNIYENKSMLYQVISFNYTSVFDKLYNILDLSKRPGVLHIHGGLVEQDIVLGMNDEQQLPQTNYDITMKGKRAFIKDIFNKSYDEQRVLMAQEWIENSDIICVFGLSLGISDLKWRDLLIKWVLSDENHHLFLYDYKCSCLKSVTVDERFDNEEEAKMEILSTWSVSEDKIEACMERIHIPCGRNIFNIYDAIQEGLLLSEKRSRLEKTLCLAKR